MRPASIGERPALQQPAAPCKTLSFSRICRHDAKLKHAAVGKTHHVHRQHIEHFVGDHRAAEGRRQGIEPLRPCRKLRRKRRQFLLLAQAQIAAHFEQEIALRHSAEFIQRQQHIAREFARARAEFEHIAAAFGEHLGNLPRQALAEQRRDLRRGDEVARRAELARSGTVVAESGRVERLIHVARERNPAVLAPDFTGNMRLQFAAVGKRFGRWLRKLAEFAR